MNKFEVAVQNEEMFLGCILKDPSLIEESMIATDQLLYPSSKALYKALQELKSDGQEITPLSIAQLGESKLIGFGGMRYVTELMNSVPSIHSFDTYQKNIINFSVVKEAQNVVGEFLEQTKETHKIKELSTLIQKMSNLESSILTNNITFNNKLQKRVEEHFNSKATGLSGINTGYESLNKYTDGWQRSDLIIVAARPSMGKTALVLNSLLNGMKKDEDIFATFFSVEMSDGPIIDRLIANEAGINLMKMRNPNKTFRGDEWEKHASAVATLEKLNFDIRRERTIPEIRSALRRNIKNNPGKQHVVALDFLTLVAHTNPTGNSHQDVSDITKDIKNIAVDLNVPFIVVSQLNRGVEARQDKRPVMSDLTESGTIEQIADVVALLYRDDYYNRDGESNGIVEVNFAKNRQGQTGKIDMKFYKETNRFFDVQR